MKILFTLTLVSLFYLSLSAQSTNNELYEKVMNELSKNELNKLKPIDNLFETADNLMQEADKMNQNIERLKIKYPYVEEKEQKQYTKQIKKLKEKSLESIILASKTYTQADTLLYNVFKENLKTVENSKSKSRTKLANLFNEEAAIHLRASKGFRALLKNKYNEDLTLEIISEIKKLEELALNKLSYSYGSYLRWSEIMNRYKSELSVNEETKYHFSIETIYSDTSLEKSNIGNITFSVQLISKRVALSEKELNSLKEKYSKIIITENESWISYSVGEFKTYADASKLSQKHENSFVVAFKNNEVLAIDLAIIESYASKK